jgi:hypothetical protein
MRTKILLTIVMAAVAFAQQTPDDARIAELRQRLSEALQMYTTAHPVVKTLQEELYRAQLFKGETRVLLPDQWWKDADTIRRLALTTDQQKRIDIVFQEHRATLLDRSAALEKAEAVLAGLMAAESKSDQNLLQAVDRVADLRAELEKARGRMLLGIRDQLYPRQWQQIIQAQPQAQPKH